MDKSECFYDGCGSIKKQAMSEANKCTVKDFVKDSIDGCMWMPSLWRRNRRLTCFYLTGQKFLPGMGGEAAGAKVKKAFTA